MGGKHICPVVGSDLVAENEIIIFSYFLSGKKEADNAMCMQRDVLEAVYKVFSVIQGTING